MKRDLRMTKPLGSSFLTCERDFQEILKKLFVENRPHSEELIRLLVLNTKDCLDNRTSEVYNKKLKEMSLGKLREERYIRLEPKLQFSEDAEVQSYIIMTMDNFVPNATNPEYRDAVISFDIICHTDCWDIGNYRVRPLKIAGYIDGILNNSKLNGIGTLEFMGCNQLVLDENLSGYTLMYRAVNNIDEDKNSDLVE